MFCLHNEVDLRPHIVTKDEVDWVVVSCKACKTHIGSKVRLIDLVDEAIKRKRQALEDLDDLLDSD